MVQTLKTTKMSEQLSFKLPIKVTHERHSFFISEANKNAVAILEDCTTWPQGKMIVLGPKASGKSHLLKIWLNEKDAQPIDPLGDFEQPEAGAKIVVDNLQNVAGIGPAETRLFHLHNHLQSTGGLLLMASSIAVRQAGFRLSDLLSRLEGTSCTKIDRPDDALLHAVLLKAFMDRQLSPSPEVLAYILKNIDRSFDAAGDIVARLDVISMSTKRPITRAMAANILN